ncbi:MAG: FprA family A-type flavoprotein [Holophagaceae bacterium]|nr:FprA family A-type flavoprotein [Holophagaceae bacterium]
MTTPFKAVKVLDDIYWVGAIDSNITEFHGYRTQRGTTYNAYLITGEKVVLIDTVKSGFKDEMMSRIASVIDPSRIDYVVCNHAEMDHSGCLPDVIREVAPEKVFASKMGVTVLNAHFHNKLDIESVEDGGELVLSGPSAPGGALSLNFMETRFLHWPDSMFSYLPQRKFLFSQDAFGMHLAGTERFDDQIPTRTLEVEAAKYFANILLPFGNLVQKLLEKIDTAGMELDIVAPAHGPVWRRGFNDVKNMYHQWSNQKLSKKVVVLYDSMWGSTNLMASAICDGIACTGVSVKQLCLSTFHRSDVATEIMDAGALVVGSPTLNNQLYPTIADSLTYLKGLKLKPRVCGTFGSFGWSGESIKYLDEIMASLGFENLGQVKTKYVPDEKVLNECHDLGRRIGNHLTNTI